MKSYKKFLVSSVTTAVAASVVAPGVFAALPTGTVVIGGQAYDLDYANDAANMQEIQQAIITGGEVYVKAPNGVWYNNDATTLDDQSVIPSVEYKDPETGETTQYEAGDGEEVSAELAVESVTAINGTDTSVVSINEGFSFSFNNELDADTVNSTNIQLLKDGAVTPVKVTLKDDKKTVEVVPTSNLAVNTEYKLVVKPAVKDAEGVALEEAYEHTFSTNNHSIATNLTVKDNTPTNIDTDVKAGEVVVSSSINQLVVTYNGSLNFAAGSKSNVTLVDEDGKAIEVDTVSASGSTLTIDLGGASVALNTGKTYKLQVNELKTADGRTVDAFTHSFSVSSGAVGVSSVKLADGTTNLTGNNIYGKLDTKYNNDGTVANYGFNALVNFNVAVDPSTVNEETIKLRNADSGEVVEASVVYNADAKTAQVTPAADLEDLTNYQLVVSVDDGIKDIFGNKLTQQDPVSFTTADVEAPTVVSTTPSNGASGIALTDNLEVTFSEPIATGSISLSSTTGNEATAGPTAVTTKTVFLKNETTGNYVDASALFNVEFSADKKTVIFKLKSGQSLSKTNSYSLILRGGDTGSTVTDYTAAGDTAVKLAENYKLSFATGEGDTTSPKVSEVKQGSTVLENNAKSVSKASTLEFFYDEALVLDKDATSLYDLKLADGTTKTLGKVKDFAALTSAGTTAGSDTDGDSVNDTGTTINMIDLNQDVAVGTVIAIKDVSDSNKVYYRTVASAYTDNDTTMAVNKALPFTIATTDEVAILPLQIVNDATTGKYKVVVTLDASGVASEVADNNTYTLKLTDAYTDADGNKAKSSSLTFTTGPAPALSVADATASTPFKFDTGFGVTETAFIQFDQSDVDLTTVTDETLYIAKADGTKAPYKITAKSATTTALSDTAAVKGSFTNVDTIKIDDAGTGSTTTNVDDVAAGDILKIATDNVFVKVVEVTQGTGETTIKVDRKVTVSDNSVVTRIPAVMLTPETDATLEGTTQYKVIANNGIRDKVGNPLKATEYVFTTAAGAAPALSVTGATVTDGEANVPVNKEIKIDFNTAIDTADIATGSQALANKSTADSTDDVILYNVTDSTQVAGSYKLSDDKKSIIVTPDTFLEAGKVYKLGVDSGVGSDSADTTKDLGTDYEIQFQTESTASVKPELTSAVAYDLDGNGMDQGDKVILSLNTDLKGDALPTVSVTDALLAFDNTDGDDLTFSTAGDAGKFETGDYVRIHDATASTTGYAVVQSVNSTTGNVVFSEIQKTDGTTGSLNDLIVDTTPGSADNSIEVSKVLPYSGFELSGVAQFSDTLKTADQASLSYDSENDQVIITLGNNAALFTGTTTITIDGDDFMDDNNNGFSGTVTISKGN
ncbi:Ig-like domain-containing protein [Bacillus tianshenii]|nr:Ig-like domain-containing protein [Bacillus tianshenii]